MLRPRKAAAGSDVVDNSGPDITNNEEKISENCSSNSSENDAVPSDHSIDNSERTKKQMISESSSSLPKNKQNSPLWVIVLSVAILFFSTLYFKKHSRSLHWWSCLFFLWIPVGMMIALGAGYRNPTTYQRIIAGGTSVVVLGNQFPAIVSLILVCAGIFIFGLASRPDPSNEVSQNTSNRGKLKAVYAALFMIVVLIIDNFFVWVVSATYTASHQGSPAPLQDNGRIVQQYILEGLLGLVKRQIVEIRAILNVQWIVVAATGLSLVVLELGMVKGRSFHGVIIRALLTIAALRAIRVVSYILTVLPSQNPRCYQHRFPLPPDDWQSWILIGFRPQSHGGCNDLIVSGHATIITSLACLSTSIAGHSFFSVAVWTLVAVDYAFECYEGFHYSVDMWMGALIGTMIWRLLADVENIEKSLVDRKLLPLSSTTERDIALYAAPVVLVFCVVAILPRWTVLFWIILFSLFAGQQISQKGFTQYVQHTLFCLLFMTLCVYL